MEDQHGGNESDPVVSSEGEDVASSKECFRSNEEKLGLHLRDMFAGPSRSIEEAFGVILGMMNKQAAEHEKLQTAVESLKMDHELELKRLTDANNALVQETAEENRRLTAAHSELKDEHEQALVDMKELSDAINVMAYNFGFGEVSDDNPSPNMETLGRNSSIRRPFLAAALSAKFLGAVSRSSSQEQESQPGLGSTSELSNESRDSSGDEGNEEVPFAIPESGLRLPDSDGGSQNQTEQASSREPLQTESQSDGKKLEEGICGDAQEEKENSSNEIPAEMTATDSNGGAVQSNDEGAAGKEIDVHLTSVPHVSPRGSNNDRKTPTEVLSINEDSKNEISASNSECSEESKVAIVHTKNTEEAEHSQLCDSDHKPEAGAQEKDRTAEDDTEEKSAAASVSGSRPTTPSTRPSSRAAEEVKEVKSAAASVIGSRPTTPATRPGSRSRNRRASFVVSKQKLDFDQTLAVRLGKLEEAQNDLEKALMEVKEMKAQLEMRLSTLPGEGTETKEELGIQTRVSIIEQFLSGFGVFGENSDTYEGEQIMDTEAHVIASSTETGESLQCQSPRADSTTETMDIDSHKVDGDGKNAGEAPTEILPHTSDKEGDSERAASATIHSEDVGTGNSQQPRDVENNVSAPQLEVSDQSTNRNTGPGEEGINRPGSGGENPPRLNFFISSQERRLTGRIDDLSRRLLSLNDEISGRVTHESLQDHLSNLKLAPTEGNDHDLSSMAKDIDDLGNKLLEMNDVVSEKVSASELDRRLHDLSNGTVSKPDLDSGLQELRDELASTSYVEKKLQEFRDEMVLDTNQESAGNIDAAPPEPKSDENAEGTVEVTDSHFKAMVERELQRLRVSKADRSELLSKLEQTEKNVSKGLESKISKHQTNVADSLQIIQDDISSCREYVDILEGRIHSPDENQEEPVNIDGELNERIKQATEAMQASLLQELAERLEGLKAVETEVERLASKLADKPDQDQIEAMLQDLEKVFSQRAKSDHAFDGFLDNMKLELRQKMTRTEVLALVRHFLNEAKQDVASHKDSLMVGRAPFRCLGCNQLYPNGVNNRLASKVNHQALPSSGPLTPSSRREKGFPSIHTTGRPGGLRSLQVMSQSRGRPRSTGALRRHKRSASLDSRKPWRNRTR